MAFVGSISRVDIYVDRMEAFGTVVAACSSSWRDFEGTVNALKRLIYFCKFPQTRELLGSIKDGQIL
jgi:hypothetical protein